MNSSTAKSSAPKTGICLDCNDHKFDCQCKGGARLATSPAHTAGPWQVESSKAKAWRDENGIFEMTEILATRGRYANMAIAYVWNRDDEDDANARLIAAAPKLLEALKNVIQNELLHDEESRIMSEEAIAENLALIAEVEGR